MSLDIQRKKFDRLVFREGLLNGIRADTIEPGFFLYEKDNKKFICHFAKNLKGDHTYFSRSILNENKYTALPRYLDFIPYDSEHACFIIPEGFDRMKFLCKDRLIHLIQNVCNYHNVHKTTVGEAFPLVDQNGSAVLYPLHLKNENLSEENVIDDYKHLFSYLAHKNEIHKSKDMTNKLRYLNNLELFTDDSNFLCKHYLDRIEQFKPDLTPHVGKVINMLI